jgi:hypothetical protein
VKSAARLLLALGALAAACGVSPDTTRIDLRAYLARTRAWAPVEAEANRTITRILATQFVDEAEIRRQIADSRPRILTHLEQVRGYTPRSKDIARIHARYVAAWETLLGGYEAIEQGFSSGDYTKLARGREAMEAWRREIQAMAAELRDLMEHFGIEGVGTLESRSGAGRPQRSTQSTKSSARPAAIA